MNWYLAVLKNYVGFEGRASRTEFWMFALFNAIIAVVLNIIWRAGVDAFLYIYILYALAVLLPSLAVAVRRLHDTGRSGLWYFIVLVPIVGVIMLLIWFCQPSQPGPNQYGAVPSSTLATA